MNKIPDDKQLINDFHRDELSKEKAFHLLVTSYGPILYNQVRRITKNHEWTNDVLQNVFIKVYQNLDGFKGDSSLYTWIYRIAHNETLNFIDKEKRRSGADFDPTYIEKIHPHDSLASLPSEEIEILLHRAIELLPEKQAMVFKLKYFEELKFSEIAQLLNTSEGGLKANYHHARQKVEQFLIAQLNL